MNTIEAMVKLQERKYIRSKLNKQSQYFRIHTLNGSKLHFPRDVPGKERLREPMGPRFWSTTFERINTLGELEFHTTLYVIMYALCGECHIVGPDGQAMVGCPGEIIGLRPGTYRIRTHNPGDYYYSASCLAFDEASVRLWSEWKYIRIRETHLFQDMGGGFLFKTMNFLGPPLYSVDRCTGGFVFVRLLGLYQTPFLAALFGADPICLVETSGAKQRLCGGDHFPHLEWWEQKGNKHNEFLWRTSRHITRCLLIGLEGSGSGPVEHKRMSKAELMSAEAYVKYPLTRKR